MRIFFSLLLVLVFFACQEADRPTQQVEVEKAIFEDKEYREN